MNVVIIGATSAIAYETAKCFACEGARLFLVARSPVRLTTIASDLDVRGAQSVETCVLDVNTIEQHQSMLDQAVAALGELDMVLIAHGTLGDQRACELSVSETLSELSTNFLSTVALLTLCASYFEARRRGCIAVITSVAGDRGRKSNYVYGTAKAGVDTFLQGLRNRLSRTGVAVLTIKPGFVATPMVPHMRPGLLVARPEVVGKGIYVAMKQRKDIVYLPWFWRPIMFVVRSIPERIFKRLSL